MATAFIGIGTGKAAELSNVDSPDAGTQDAHFRKGDHWVGTYICAQGLTNLDLQIVAASDGIISDAIFNFEDTRHGTSGAFHMTGTHDFATHEATFVPGEWIRQPPNFVTVGMKGTVHGATFAGDITMRGCTSFSITRVASGDPRDKR